MNAKYRVIFRIVSIVAILFGLLTIKSGGMVLFTGGEAHQAAGNYVPFVLWFNFIAGFAYIAAGIGLWQQRSCARKLAAFIAMATVVVFAALGVHILNDGAYEMRTVVAMSARSTIWIIIALVAFFLARRGRQGVSLI
jgi:di/tricarboxylate transporter